MKNLIKIAALGLIASFSLNHAYAAEACTVTKASASATATVLEKSAGCDGGPSKVESIKPAAVKPLKAKKVVETTDSSTVKALAEENIRLRAQSTTSVALAPLAQSPAMQRYPAEGVVYSDPDGNTFERHLGGAKECKFYANGRLEKSVFAPVGLNPVAAKQYCDLQAQEFYATKTPTTPEATSTTPVVYQAPSLATTAVAANTAPAVSASTGGNVICSFKIDGKVVKTTNTESEAACKAWTLQEAKELGKVPAT